MAAILINGTSGNNALVITATTDDSGSYVLNGAAAQNFSGATSFTFNGSGGNDALSIVNPTGLLLGPPGGIFVNGGGQAGDSFAELGGAADGGSYAASAAPDAGTLTHVVSEVQHVTVTGAGTFTLTFGGQTTGSLADSATALQVQSALDGLSSMGFGGFVTVTGGAGDYTIKFAGNLADADQTQITATGTGTVVTAATEQDGGPKTVQLTGVASVRDTVAEQNFAAGGTAGTDAITIADGPIVGGQRTMQISSPSFETLSIANKTFLTINGEGGGDTVTFDNPDPAPGVSQIFVENAASVAGSNPSGADIVVTSLQLEAGADIGSGGPLRTQVGSLFADAGLAGAGGINIDNGVNLAVTLNIEGVSATNAAGGTIVLTNNGTIAAIYNNEVITATGFVDVTANGNAADIDAGGQAGAAITSNTGSVILQAGRDINLGNFGGSGSLDAATGIILTAGRNLTLADNSSVTNSTSGNVIVTAGGDIAMLAGSRSEFVNNAAGGSIFLGAGAGHSMTLDSTGTDAVASFNGSLTLTADAMSIKKGVLAGTARATLAPASFGEAINLGAADLPGALGLTQSELDLVTAAVLQVGAATAGSINFASSIAPPAGSNVLTLISGGGIAEHVGASLTALNLRISAAQAITLDNPNNSIQVFAGAGSATVTVVDATSLSVGTVDGVAGIFGSGPITVAASTAGTTLDVQQAITTNAPGANVTLAFDNMSLTQTIDAGAGIVTLQPFSVGQQIALGATSSPGTLGISDAALGLITASVVRIDGNAGNISIAGAVTRHAGFDTLSLATGGNTSQAAALAVADLALRSGGNVTLTNVSNNVDVLAFDNIGGSLIYTDLDDLTIGAVDGLATSSNTGAVTLITAGGDMLFSAGLSAAGIADLISTTGTIEDNGASAVVTATTLLLSASTRIGTVADPFSTQATNLGADTATGGILIANGTTTAVTLNIAGTDGIVVSGAAGNIQLTNQGSIDILTAGATVSGPAHVIIEALGAASDIDTGGQSSQTSIVGSLVAVTAGRDINLGDSIGHGSIAAGSGSVTLTAGRNITLNANSTVVSISGGITATASGDITMLTSPGGLFDAPAFATGGGGIALTSGAGHTLTLASTGADAVSSEGGTVTLTADNMAIGAGVDAGGGIVRLQPTTNGRVISLGTATGGLHLSAAALNEVTATTLVIGNGTAGSVSIGGAVGPTGAQNLTIRSGGNVVVAAAAKLGATTSSALTVSAGGNFTVGAGGALRTTAAGIITIDFGTKGLGNTADLHNAAITVAETDVTGGAGNDTIEFSAANLKAADKVTGGAGNDKLVITSAGTIAAGGVSGIETIQLANGGPNSLTLANANLAGVSGGSIAITGGNSGNTVNASTLTGGNRVVATGGSGADHFTGGAGNDVLNGGAGNDTLSGGAGNDTLNGGAGNDAMAGGTGNDTYIVDNAGDVVTEASAGGTDTVKTALASYTLGANVENLVYTGAGSFAGTGNALANALTGGAGNDTLDGGLGNDSLTGGAGNDSFLFDSALGTGNIDHIFDFSSVGDTILLKHAIFANAGTAGTTLAAGAFHIGSAAADADDRIVYNSSTGALIYDSNGNAAGGATQFATLSTGLALSAGNFHIVA